MASVLDNEDIECFHQKVSIWALDRMSTPEGSHRHWRSLTQERQAWNRANPTGPASTELPHTFLAAFFSMAFGTRRPAAAGAMDYVWHLAERPCSKRAGLKGCGKGGGQENVNSEESRARKERIKLYSCRAEECP